MVSKLAVKIKEVLYARETHPYWYFEEQVAELLHRRPGTLLDVGCGREALVLRKFKGQAERLLGLDLIEYRVDDPDVTLLHGSISAIPLRDGCVDVIMARSVMEHITEPLGGFREVNRVLKKGGAFVFLTANLWDYASLLAMLIPNRFHPWIVARSEGRAEGDVFPTAYKCNSKGTVYRIARQVGLDVTDFRYLSQYPNYFMFNGPLFLLASGYEK
ncbi:MAG: class I SAM-dependent methyltransferase, partial [Nitrososphaera sp.]|nr:class I SAM-dependent methyltransferase [Nitrososphaera sp.]